MSDDHEATADDLFAGFSDVNPSEEASARALQRTRHALIERSEKPVVQNHSSLSPNSIVRAWAGIHETFRCVVFSRSNTQNRPRRRFVISARIAAVIFFVAALIGGVYLVGGPAESHAFAEVQKALENVQSVTFTMRRTEGDRPEQITKVMLLGKDRARAEWTSGEILVSDRKTGKTMQIIPQAKKVVISDTAGSADYEFILDVMWLRNIPEDAVAEREDDIWYHPKLHRAEEGESDGKRFRVVCYFLLDANAVVFVDPKTHLPTRVMRGNLFNSRPKELATIGDGASLEPVDEVEGLRVVASDFIYGADVDPALFSLTPPEGFSVETSKSDR